MSFPGNAHKTFPGLEPETTPLLYRGQFAQFLYAYSQQKMGQAHFYIFALAPNNCDGQGNLSPGDRVGSLLFWKLGSTMFTSELECDTD